jgi:hypothetical protein
VVMVMNVGVMAGLRLQAATWGSQLGDEGRRGEWRRLSLGASRHEPAAAGKDAGRGRGRGRPCVPVEINSTSTTTTIPTAALLRPRGVKKGWSLVSSCCRSLAGKEMKKRADDAGGAHSDGAGGRQRREGGRGRGVDADTGQAGGRVPGTAGVWMARYGRLERAGVRVPLFLDYQTPEKRVECRHRPHTAIHMPVEW